MRPEIIRPSSDPQCSEHRAAAQVDAAKYADAGRASEVAEISAEALGYSEAFGRNVVAIVRFGNGIMPVMALLATEPWISAGRDCDVIGLDKAAVSRSVHGMKSNGTVDVQRTDDDQSRQLIALTPKDLNLHDRIVKLSLEREGQLLKGFSAAERKLLINFLSRMHTQVVDTNATGTRRNIS